MEALETVLFALGQFFTVILGSVERAFPWFVGLILALSAMVILTRKLLIPMLGSAGSDSVISEEEQLRRQQIDKWNNSVKTRHRRMKY